MDIEIFEKNKRLYAGRVLHDPHPTETKWELLTDKVRVNQYIISFLGCRVVEKTVC